MEADRHRANIRGMRVKASRIAAMIMAALVMTVGRAHGQANTSTIGFLGVRSETADAQIRQAFHKGLAEGGFVEGRTVRVEYRWANGDSARLPALAQAFVQSRVD